MASAATNNTQQQEEEEEEEEWDIKTPEEVLYYWFKDNRGRDNAEDKWFKNGKLYDDEIEEIFGDTLEAVVEGYLSRWLRTKMGTLAFIILTDQFPRHIYRGHEASFAFGPIALTAAKRIVQHYGIETFTSAEANFILLPFEHSEDIRDHDKGIQIMKSFLRRRPSDKILLSTLESQLKSRAVIEKFGRKPTRNEILGRLSTEEEKEYLLGLKGIPVDLTYFHYLGGKVDKSSIDLSMFFYLGGKMSSNGYGSKYNKDDDDIMISKL